MAIENKPTAHRGSRVTGLGKTQSSGSTLAVGAVDYSNPTLVPRKSATSSTGVPGAANQSTLNSPGQRAEVNCFDVAAYILEKTGELTTMKLQKLVYYCQAWSLVWDEAKLFPQGIKAWANGPVVPDLYRWHARRFAVSECPKGDSSKLSKEQKETVDAVLGFYGHRASQWLSDLTHSELPWREARRGLAVGERGRREITAAAMNEYYLSL